MMVKQAKQSREQRGSDPRPKRWQRLRRVLLSVLAVTLAGLLLAWLYLPRIAEHLLRDVMADSGLQGYEFRVKRIGAGSAVIEAVAIADRDWKVRAERVRVSYDLGELRSRRIEAIAIEGMVVDLDLPDATGTKKDLRAAWVHDLPGLMERLGNVRADDAQLAIGRLGRSATRRMDLALHTAPDGRISMQVDADDFELGVELENTGRRAELSVQVSDLRPVPFLSMLRVVLGLGKPLLPEGMNLAKAEMAGGLVVEDGVLSPLTLNGSLSGLVYSRGEKSPRVRSTRAEMKLVVDAAGGGMVDLEGELDELTLPVGLSAGFGLRQTQGHRASWQLGATWGGETTRLEGSVAGLQLSGQYRDKAVELEDGAFGFQMAGDVLKVDGDMSNGGIKVPVRYRHELKHEKGGWAMQGEAKLGPFSHDHTLPAARAAIGFFDGVEVAGESSLSLDFVIGSRQAFSGKLVARLTEGEVNVADGKLKASQVSGVHELQIHPDTGARRNAANASRGNDHILNVSVGKLEIASKDALGFDLVHQADKPATITGKGTHEDDGMLLAGAVSGLQLYGEKAGSTLKLEDIGLSFKLDDGRLGVDGVLTLAGNKIPFTYRHERKEMDAGWQLNGVAELKQADLKQAVNNIGMFVDAMEGKSISGQIAMKLDFALGSEQDFDGGLKISIRDGVLSFPDEGPVIEGLAAELELDSLVQKTTRGFHPVMATQMTAFDVVMSDLGLEFQLLPGGDIKLRNIGLKALGGQIAIDDFVLPGDDADYAFKLRAKRLEVARLADLFPDFSGSISGSIDGLLPLEVKNGEVTPGTGGMYLTPMTRGKLVYDAGNSFSAGLDPKSEEYKRMKMVEDSLRNLELKVLSIRLFDPRDGNKAVVLRLEGQAPHVIGSPPIHLNINGFKPDDETMDFFDLLLRQRERIDFGF